MTTHPAASGQAPSLLAALRAARDSLTTTSTGSRTAAGGNTGKNTDRGSDTESAAASTVRAVAAALPAVLAAARVGDTSAELDVQLSWLLADTAVADALTRLTTADTRTPSASSTLGSSVTRDAGEAALASGLLAAGLIPPGGADERVVRGEAMAVLAAARARLSRLLAAPALPGVAALAVAGANRRLGDGLDTLRRLP